MRTILITGAASGIGAGVARQLVDSGSHLIVTDLEAEAPSSAPSGCARTAARPSPSRST